eukprot:g2629.t1
MAAPKSAIKSRSEPSFSISVPSCAEPSESVRWELQRAGALVPDNGASGASSEWRGVGRNAEEKFGSERERLDFHGLAGDVRGFTAFLTHRYGSICRGWRTGVAPDEMGLAPVLQSESRGASGFETGAQLAHRHVFGFKSGVKGNVHFTDDAHLLYPAGHNTILYHADHKSQIRVFPGSEGSEGISSLALSPNRKFLAVCEKFQERAVCYVYDVTTGKRRRGQLTYGECDAREYVCAAFSAENKLLITQGGPPDWTLILWSWDKAKAHGAVKVSNLTGSMIHECSFNPQDSSLVCIIGDGVFKFFRLQDGTFKGIPNQLNKMREARGLASNQNYICHTWLNDDRLIVCSEAGDALLFDSGGEFKMVLPCSPCEPRSLLCVASFSRGFIAGGEKGVVTFYERSDDAKETSLLRGARVSQEMFRKAKEVKLDSSMSGPMMPSVGAVTAMTVSPAEETVAIATGSNQLLTFSLSPTDIMKAEEGNVDFALTSFHTGPIFGLDVCVRKPLVVTCGTDKTVRIWNFVDRTQELCKVFNEERDTSRVRAVRRPASRKEAFSVAFHPSGFHLIVGFADKVRLMNLLMEDFRTYKEIPIKACRETRFSHGGQFFAAVNSNTIQVYKTYTCEVVCNLRGHQSKVKAVCWTSDDFRLVSCGQDGAAYEYDILKEGRRGTNFASSPNFTSIVSHTDFEAATPATTLYVAGSDKMLKEVRESSLTNYLESNAVLGQLALAPCTQALIAGVAEQELPGSLRCYTFPLTGDYVEYQAHAAPVSRIRITWDELYLFSTGDDGCLCIFDIKKNGPPRKDKDHPAVVASCCYRKKTIGSVQVVNRRAPNLKADGLLAKVYVFVLPPTTCHYLPRQDFGLGYADEILVTRQFLDEKQATLLEFERRVRVPNTFGARPWWREGGEGTEVEELDSRIAFQLRHRDGLHKEKMAEMQEKYSEEIETERRKFEVLREEKAEMEMENEEHVKTLEENHARYLQEQQESFDQKMIVEDQRYKKLEADLEREKQEWDAQHSALLAEHAQVIEQMKQDAEKIQRANRETMDRDIKEKERAAEWT